MRKRKEFFETAAAPSPTVPTRRSNSSSSKRGRRFETAQPTTLAMVANKASLYQARSAGAAARPKKNEDVVELVQFFKTYDGPLREQPSSMPSSPVPPSPEPQSAGARDFLKAGHRRLRQLAQRQKRDSDSKPKSDDPSNHLFARQCGAYFSAPKPKVLAMQEDLDATLSHSKSLESMRTNFKCEVENIGQPWLEDMSEKKSAKEQQKMGLSPMALRALREFTSVIDVAEPRPLNGDDEVPPPYQQLPQPRSPVVGHSSTEQLSIIEEAPFSTDDHGQKADGSGSSASDPVRTKKTSDNVNGGTAVTIPQSSEASDAKSSRDTPSGRSCTRNTTAIQCTAGKQQGDSNPEMKHHESRNRTTAANTEASVPTPSKRSFSQPLKLFPDVLPPRTSSRCAVRSSSHAPKPSTASSSSSMDSKESSSPTTETKRSSPTTSSKVLRNVDPILRPHSSAQRRSKQAAEQGARLSGNGSNKSSQLDDKTGGRRTSLLLQPMHASPLPAPTNPLPALPKPESADGGRPCGKENTNGLIVQANATPRDIHQSPWLPPNRQKTSTPNGVRPISPMPAAAFEPVDPTEEAAQRQDGSSQAAASNQSLSALLDRRHRNQVGRIRALNLKDNSHSRPYLDAGKPQIERLAESSASPAAPQATTQLRNHPSPVSHRRSPELIVEAGLRTPRSVASAFPTPPPRSPLPSDPPIRPRAGEPFGRRYLHSPNDLPTSPVDHNETTSPQACESPRTCRSDSTRSASVCREAMHSKRKHSEYSESPIPSSDDEGPGTLPTYPPPNRRRRVPATRKSIDAAASRLAHQTRKEDCFNSTKSLTPRSQNCHDAWVSPPQSPHSGYTHRSQGSQTSYTSNATSVVHSLQMRIAHLEQQNSILQAVLVATLDASGKVQTDSLLNGLAASFSGSRTSSIIGRPVSSLASYSPAVDESVSKLKHAKDDGIKSSRYCHNWQASRDNISLSSFETSTSKRDFAPVKALGCMKEDIQHDWLPNVEGARAIRSS